MLPGYIAAYITYHSLAPPYGGFSWVAAIPAAIVGLVAIAATGALFGVGKDKEQNQEDKHGLTPLHRACKIGDLPLVQTLLKAGADINARDKHG